MSVKILISTITSLNDFFYNPLDSFNKVSNSILAILIHNKLIFYVVTLKELTKLLYLKTLVNIPNNKLIYRKIFKNNQLNNVKKQIRKFPMYIGWKNIDNDFEDQLILSGIFIDEKVIHAELAYFTSYWKTKKKFIL